MQFIDDWLRKNVRSAETKFFALILFLKNINIIIKSITILINFNLKPSILNS